MWFSSVVVGMVIKVRSKTAQTLLNMLVWYVIYQVAIEEWRGGCNEVLRRIHAKYDPFDMYICGQPYWEMLMEHLGLSKVCFKIGMTLSILKHGFV
jgi:hypothetical protein